MNKMTIPSKGEVTIIIPCYNYGRFLGEAIESALAQTSKAKEIIVIDDASTDNTDQVAKLYPVSYVKNSENLGLVKSLTKASALVKTEYMMFLSADDRLRPSYLAATSAVLDASLQVAIAYTHMALFGPYAKDVYETVPARKMGREGEFYLWRVREFNRAHLLNKGNFIHGSALFRRSAFFECGGFTETNHVEDYLLWKKIIQNNWNAKLVPDYLLEYRHHSPNQRNVAGTNAIQKYLKNLFKKISFYLGLSRY